MILPSYILNNSYYHPISDRFSMNTEECFKIYKQRAHSYVMQKESYKILIAIVLWFEYATINEVFAKSTMPNRQLKNLAKKQLSELLYNYKFINDDNKLVDDDNYKTETLDMFNQLSHQISKQFRVKYSNAEDFDLEIIADDLADRVYELLGINTDDVPENNFDNINDILKFIGRL